MIMNILKSILVILTSVIIAQASFDQAGSCKVFCEGPILDAVQRAHLFPDNKHFVDMPMVYDPETTLAAFAQLPNKTDVNILREFVNHYFTDPGTELDSCQQSDWLPEPKAFEKIHDPVYRQWAYSIHAKWRTLCRRMKDEVRQNPDRYSLIHSAHPFIAPGGRFREFYYWDTYWIVRGLLASQMYNSTKAVISNLADMIQRFGFVPNGGRVYYLHRTQPPLFSGCVHEYFKATNDLEFVKAMLPLMEKERVYWRRERSVDLQTVDGDSAQFYQYRATAHGPRPESYKEDIDTVAHVNSEKEKVNMWSDIASACESGWDFSSRWFSHDETNPFKYTLRSVRTSQIVPVDLNAFACWNEAIMTDLYAAVGNKSQSDAHRHEHETMKHNMKKLFWNAEKGSWFDLDLETGRQREDFYISNPTPLFARCAHDSKNVHEQVLDYLKQSGAASFAGGLPTSFVHSGEQWDSPNGWAPTNHMVIEALASSTDPRVQDAAFRLADKWIQTNYFVFVRSGGKMFEKYNVETFKSQAGGGGEYEVQEGFGWSNGVILDLLLRYGDRIRAPPVPSLLAESVKGIIDY
jgi:alpha,alpha-trehalase